MLSSLLAMAGFALAGAITPGPVNVLALRHGCESTKSIAMLYVLGASLSYTAIVWLMGQGGHWLLEQPTLALWTPRLCAAYLLWLAWKLARAPAEPAAARSGEARTSTTPRSFPAFLQGAAVQGLNPKAWLVALSGVGMFVLPLSAAQMPLHMALAWFCAVSLTACLLGVGCWATLGRALSQWLTTPARQQGLNRLLALMLVSSVFSMLA
ncbi:MAG: LysE family transporter [Comamonas sp.]|jgi:threonine/homoserine/homoserine lactone efflux protein|nr:LysE family transporter [Comamonas sp.]